MTSSHLECSSQVPRWISPSIRILFCSSCIPYLFSCSPWASLLESNGISIFFFCTYCLNLSSWMTLFPFKPIESSPCCMGPKVLGCRFLMAKSVNRIFMFWPTMHHSVRANLAPIALSFAYAQTRILKLGAFFENDRALFDYLKPASMDCLVALAKRYLVAWSHGITMHI